MWLQEPINRILNISYGVLIGAICVLIFAFWGVRLLGIRPYMITSGSMIPEYPIGSIVYAKGAELEEIHIGETITFYIPESDIVATHQVYEIDYEQELCYTQGTNNYNTDGELIKDGIPVPIDAVIGKIILCIPYLGWVNRFCTNPPGMFFLIGFVLCYCFCLYALEKLVEKDCEDVQGGWETESGIHYIEDK